MSYAAIERSFKSAGTTESDKTAKCFKRRVLIVAPSLDILGGQAVQAARLLDRLRNETSIEVAFLPVNPRLPVPLNMLQRIKYVRTIVTSLLYWGLLLARVRKYEVIHIFSASYFSFLLAPTPAILVAKLYRKKIVLNYRSGEAADHLSRWRRTAVPTMRLADEIVVPSGYLVDVLAQFELVSRAVPNLLDTNQFSFRERKRLRPIFLSNRNFEPLYNVACILRAFQIIQQRWPDAKLILAGDGSQRRELEALSQELKLRNVQFVGRVAPSQMTALYDSADVYLNSPDIDNMPGSIIEAFACGLPVVTTDAGGIPYIVENGRSGLVVRCGDYRELAENALSLLEDRLLAQRLTAAGQHECDKYNWSAVRSEWLKVYFGG